MAQAPITRVAFYFSAHGDDWQLFMNPPAFADVLDERCHTVFVHVTAGDAGLGIGNGGRQHPYYLARENGAEAAARFMADANKEHPLAFDRTTVAIEGHALRRVGTRDTCLYFLRLPDGGTEGEGYDTTGRQSLKRFSDKVLPAMVAVDSSASYGSWDDLCKTLYGLILHETPVGAAIELHVPELDPALNPNDHPDHVMTARAARDAGRGLTARWHHHAGYASNTKLENLSAADRDMKCAVYAVTVAGVQAYDHQMAWQHYDELFAGRSYCRIEDSGPVV